jgi:hypothetical protein
MLWNTIYSKRFNVAETETNDMGEKKKKKKKKKNYSLSLSKVPGSKMKQVQHH